MKTKIFGSTPGAYRKLFFMLRKAARIVMTNKTSNSIIRWKIQELRKNRES